MAYTLLYFDEIEKDILNAKCWYKDQKEGLEIEFATSIERTIGNIINAATTE